MSEVNSWERMSVTSLSLTGGHSDSVCCLEQRGDILFSGGEGGALCQWDLRSRQLIAKVAESQQSCMSVCLPTLKDHTVFAAFGETIHQFDTRNIGHPVVSLNGCEDEINQIVLNEKEEFLAACDDTGNVKIFSVRPNENKLFKTLRNKHTNICSTVLFRPGKPWDIFTGGFDCQLIHWDFGKHRSLNMLNMQELMNDGSLDSVSYVLNPPFVHHVDMSPDGKLLGCGLGNGSVVLFDSSRRHIKQSRSFQAHSQGVSQIHFIGVEKFVTGSNDNHVLIWDVGDVHGQGAGDAHVGHAAQATPTNGHSSTHPVVNPPTANQLVELRIDHKFKINWLKPFWQENCLVIAVADQRADITLYTIPS